MALILLFRRWSFVGREKAGSAGSGFFSAGDLFRTVMTGVNRRDQRRQSTADCLPSFGKWQLVTVCCSPSPSGLFSRDVKPHLRVARTGRPASRRRRLTRDKCFWRRARSGAVRARTVTSAFGAEHEVGLFAPGPAETLYISWAHATSATRRASRGGAAAAAGCARGWLAPGCRAQR